MKQYISKFFFICMVSGSLLSSFVRAEEENTPQHPTLTKSISFSKKELPPIYIEYPLILKRGETLTELLIDHGFTRAHAAKAMYRLQRAYNVKKLRPKQEVILSYKKDWEKDTVTFKSITFYTPDDKNIYISPKGKNDFTVKITQRALSKKPIAIEGTIQDSLYYSAKKAHLPAALVPAFANLFGWEMDFTRDIRPGDTFRVVYERILDEEGRYLRSGNILAAELSLSKRKKTLDAYRTKTKYGVGYYSSKGYNKQRTLLRTPLEFTRISSNFNLKRKHPILGYTRAHKGTDFAAPTGTPVRAAGDGIVEKASWYGGYGRYIRLKHSKKFKTAYAHLYRYARGIKPGKHVRQGQIIAYVGTSGRSTGPHLHYEVIRYGKHVNPMTVKLPMGKAIPKKQKEAFNKNLHTYQAMWKALSLEKK